MASGAFFFFAASHASVDMEAPFPQRGVAHGQEEPHAAVAGIGDRGGVGRHLQESKMSICHLIVALQSYIGQIFYRNSYSKHRFRF
jgi:hypothetical protein